MSGPRAETARRPVEIVSCRAPSSASISCPVGADLLCLAPLHHIDKLAVDDWSERWAAAQLPSEGLRKRLWLAVGWNPMSAL